MSDVETVKSNGKEAKKPEEVRPELPTAMAAPEMGKLGGEAIIQFCEAAAVHIEQVGQEIMAMAESTVAESKILVENMRMMAQLESERTVAFTTRLKEAAQGITAARAKFDDLIKK